MVREFRVVTSRGPMRIAASNQKDAEELAKNDGHTILKETEMLDGEEEAVIYYREHEYGPKKPRMRIWTEKMAGYGQFDVISADQFTFLQFLEKNGYVKLEVGQED